MKIGSAVGTIIGWTAMAFIALIFVLDGLSFFAAYGPILLAVLAFVAMAFLSWVLLLYVVIPMLIASALVGVPAHYLFGVEVPLAVIVAVAAVVADADSPHSGNEPRD